METLEAIRDLIRSAGAPLMERNKEGRTPGKKGSDT